MAVQRAIKEAKNFGIKRAVALHVSAPFHCPLMQPAAERLEQALGEIPFADALIPLVTNVEAQPLTEGEKLKKLLVQQVTAPVRWEESMRQLETMGVRGAIEIGPGKVLSGLLRRIVKSIETLNVETPEQIAACKG
jgi:[acyl-carrier-protein] S-malonyltransferase